MDRYRGARVGGKVVSLTDYMRSSSRIGVEG
jgi:hypothetical protein